MFQKWQRNRKSKSINQKPILHMNSFQAMSVFQRKTKLQSLGTSQRIGLPLKCVKAQSSKQRWGGMVTQMRRFLKSQGESTQRRQKKNTSIIVARKVFVTSCSENSLASPSKAKVLNTNLDYFSSRRSTGKPWRWDKQTKLKSGMRTADMGVGTQYQWNLFASLNYLAHPSRICKFSKQDGKESDQKCFQCYIKACAFFHQKL